MNEKPSNPDLSEQGVDAEQAFTLMDSNTARQQLEDFQQRLSELTRDADPLQRAKLLLEIATYQLALEQFEAAWSSAKQAFPIFIEKEQWQEAVEACDVMYQCELDDSILALAQGIWLAVTFPIEPHTTIAMLQHLIEETPDSSDGAAVAAITAHYITDLRASNEQRDSLLFLCTQLIAKVAQRHSHVDNQEKLDFWLERLELNDPQIFLPRMASVLDSIVQEKWWYNRDELRNKIPV